MSELSFLRFVITALLNIFVIVVQTPPNLGSEVGEGDEVAEKGVVQNYFKKFLIIVGTNIFLSIADLYVNAFESLTFFDVLFVLIAIAGFSLRVWCYYILDKFFTFTVVMKKDHKLITEGPYEYLVHPSYTGQLVTLYGAVLYYSGFDSIIGYLALGVVAYLIVHNVSSLPTRMKVEEDAMSKKFGDEYKTYLSKRWKLIPYVY